MTMMEILMACVGFLLCMGIFTVVCLLIMLVVWWIFKTNQDIEIETEDWEDENNGMDESIGAY